MAELQHILAVDDDAATRDLVADYLNGNGFRVTTVADGREMDRVLAQHRVDLIVLDLKLPDEDGLDLARKVRVDSDVPIIIVTGRRDEVDRVVGLELGADDYLTKPFSPRELLARIRAVLRRAELRAAPPDDDRIRYRFSGWELDPQARSLSTPSGDFVPLTNGEFNLLKAFLDSPNRVLSRDRLLELSRLHDDEVFDRSIDVQILRLRRKLESDPSEPDLIRTERGAGYKFNAKVQML